VGDEVKDDEMAGAWDTYGEKRDVCGILVGKPEAKRPLGSPRHRGEYSIKVALK
jgi:hypothetical protein